MDVSSLADEAGERVLSVRSFCSGDALQRGAQLVQLLLLGGQLALELELARLQRQLAEGGIRVGQGRQRLQHLGKPRVLLHRGHERCQEAEHVGHERGLCRQVLVAELALPDLLTVAVTAPPRLAVAMQRGIGALRGDEAVEELEEKRSAVSEQSVAILGCHGEERLHLLLQLQPVCAAQEVLGQYLTNPPRGELLAEGLRLLRSQHALYYLLFCLVLHSSSTLSKEHVVQLLFEILGKNGLHGGEDIHILVEGERGVLRGGEDGVETPARLPLRDPIAAQERVQNREGIDDGKLGMGCLVSALLLWKGGGEALRLLHLRQVVDLHVAQRVAVLDHRAHRLHQPRDHARLCHHQRQVHLHGLHLRVGLTRHDVVAALHQVARQLPRVGAAQNRGVVLLAEHTCDAVDAQPQVARALHHVHHV